MGFLIEVSTGEDGKLWLRGQDDGNVEFCRMVDLKDPKTGKMKPTPVPYKFYPTIDSALDKLFRMRVNSRNATTLQELLQNVREEREELRVLFTSEIASKQETKPKKEEVETPVRSRRTRGRK